MSELRFESVNFAELIRVSASFASGRHVVLGSERDGTGNLVQLAAGLARPNAGRVTLDGRSPFASAELRRGIAAACANDQLPDARSVADSLGLALRAQGDTRSALSVLDAAGLTRLAGRRSSEIAAREAGGLALALALSHPKPTLVALHEPLALLGILSEEFVLQSLARCADAAAIVLCTASRLEDAARLGGALSALDRGTWLESARARPPLSQVTLRVQTPEPRRLAARLSEAPELSAVEWAGGQELLVRGAELEAISRCVVANARAEAIRISALRCDPPPLEALVAARAGLAQAASERAHREAQALPVNERPIFALPEEPR